MRKVAYKIWLGYAVVVSICTFAMVMAYRAASRIEKEMNRLVEVHEPVKVAAHEMEINMKGVALGTLAYLNVPDPAFRASVGDAEADFARFHAEYLRLARTEQEKKFGEAIRPLFQQFTNLSRQLKLRRDRQAETFADALGRLEELDRLFDQQLPSTLSRRRAEDQAKLESISEVDEGIDGIRMRVAIYRWAGQSRQMKPIHDGIEACRAAFGRLKKFEWATESHRQAVLKAEQDFEIAMGKVQEVLAEEDAVVQNIARFIALRHQLDDLLDEHVQPFAAEQLRDPIVRAELLTDAVVLQMGWLLGLFLVTAILASVVLTRTVTRPLETLTRGTETVSRGDLAYRVPVLTRDEFARLAQAFNHMVERLQETLVSKGALEKSEQELQVAVQALRQQISDRIRAEAEQRRLQASLRRSERLASMGTLVAGVAHQVRNPLFGMSSVLDAMEARLGQRQEYQRYLEILRSESARVTVLMHELFEYARSGDEPRSSESVSDVIHHAVEMSRALARKAQVTMVEDSEESLPAVPMDRPRISRAFENLLENAIQHSTAGNAVSVTARTVEQDGREWVEVCVEDDGPGFKEEDLPRIFEPFFTRRPGGTGLGLALVERIVESHRGQVGAANRPGRGAVLTVRLPVKPSTNASKPSAPASDRVMTVEEKR